MYTIILSMIIVAIITAIIVQFIKDLDGYPGCKIFAILLFGIGIGSIIGLFIAGSDNPPTRIVQAHKEIICLKDNSSIKGSLFIGCGNINGTMCYSMYIKDHNRVYLKQIDCNDASIQFIKDGEKPEIIERAEIALNRKWFFFFDHAIECIIRIPKNSIKQEILLDAE